MAEVTDVFFIMQFIGFLIITILKLHNVMNLGKTYQISKDDGGKETKDLRWPFILFILFVIMWFIGHVSFMNNPTVFTLSLYRIETICYSLHFIFLFFEIFYYFKGMVVSQPRKAYNSMKLRKV